MTWEGAPALLPRLLGTRARNSTGRCLVTWGGIRRCVWLRCTHCELITSSGSHALACYKKHPSSPPLSLLLNKPSWENGTCIAILGDVWTIKLGWRRQGRHLGHQFLGGTVSADLAPESLLHPRYLALGSLVMALSYSVPYLDSWLNLQKCYRSSPHLSPMHYK